MICQFGVNKSLNLNLNINKSFRFSDLTMHELQVLPRDLQLCRDVATGVDSLGQFQWGDLVALDAQTVGVIVRLEKENFQVRIRIFIVEEKAIQSCMNLKTTSQLK